MFDWPLVKGYQVLTELKLTMRTSSSTYSAIMLRVEIPATTCGSRLDEF